MGFLTYRLGYGVYGTVDAEFPNDPIHVTLDGSQVILSQSTATRILEGNLNNNEEIRLDKPQIYDGTFEYGGLALNGSSIDDPIWNIIRVSWVANRRTRVQYRENIAWSSRTEGWAQ